MSRQCVVCNKKTTVATQRKKLMSKYNPTPKKRKYPNLQTIAVPEKAPSSFKDFAGKRIKACAKCIKTLSK